MLRAVVILLAMGQVAPASWAQGESGAGLSFMRCLIGDWTVEILEFDSAGETVWEGSQQRVFEPVISARFLQESAIPLNAEDRREIGRHIYGWDADTVYMSGFWIMSSDRFQHFEGIASETGDGELRLDGVMEVRRPGTLVYNVRSEMGFTEQGGLVWRVFDREGREREVLAYERQDQREACVGTYS